MLYFHKYFQFFPHPLKVLFHVETIRFHRYVKKNVNVTQKSPPKFPVNHKKMPKNSKSLDFTIFEERVLVDQVKKFPVLYVKLRKKANMKRHFWRRIAKKVTRKAEECKLCWNYISTYYRNNSSSLLKYLRKPAKNLGVRFRLDGSCQEKLYVDAKKSKKGQSKSIHLQDTDLRGGFSQAKDLKGPTELSGLQESPNSEEKVQQNRLETRSGGPARI